MNSNMICFIECVALDCHGEVKHYRVALLLTSCDSGTVCTQQASRQGRRADPGRQSTLPPHTFVLLHIDGSDINIDKYSAEHKSGKGRHYFHS